MPGDSWHVLRWCWQRPPPTHSLHSLLLRWCWQMLAPPHSLHALLMRWCGQMRAPPLPRIRAISFARLPLEAKVLSAQISASVSSFRSSRFVFGDFADEPDRRWMAAIACARSIHTNPRALHTWQSVLCWRSSSPVHGMFLPPTPLSASAAGALRCHQSARGKAAVPPSIRREHIAPTPFCTRTRAVNNLTASHSHMQSLNCCQREDSAVRHRGAPERARNGFPYSATVGPHAKVQPPGPASTVGVGIVFDAGQGGHGPSGSGLVVAGACPACPCFSRAGHNCGQASKIANAPCFCAYSRKGPADLSAVMFPQRF
jgi:hypothetical protein